MLEGLRRFFADLAGPARPCDVCQLGRPDAATRPRASQDWRFNDRGLDAEFFICGRCRSLIVEAGLQHHLPFVAVACLVARGKIEQPPTEAFLAHPMWRKVLEHMMTTTGSRPLSDSDALRALRQMQENLIARFNA